MEKDYYKILGVTKDASQDDIKKAFQSVSISSQFSKSWNLTRLAHYLFNMGMSQSKYPFIKRLIHFLSFSLVWCC